MTGRSGNLEHEHHHEHGNGHHHEHANERILSFEYAQVALSSHIHEQAATVSATISLLKGYTIEFSSVIDSMREIAVQAEAAGGIVGHIKGYAETVDGFAHASCTAADLGVNVQGDPALVLDADSNLQLVAIVMLIDQNVLEGIVTSALA